jgi:chaperone required for assembly of F1-ATPase
LDLRKGFHEPVEKPRRFYKAVEAAEVEGGWSVLLDTRRLRTPKAQPFVIPTRPLAELCANEWATQTDVIEMATMHATRLANTALDAIPQARADTADQIARYAASDLVCYFAEGPEGLVARQEAGWLPLMARAEAELGLRFERCRGIVFREQPSETLAGVRAHALSEDDFGLAGLAFGAALYGSAVLALAARRGWIDATTAYDLSRIDEAFQEEAWGVDAEAAERTHRLRGEAAVLDAWFRSLAA